jgi:hypothetical protein
VTSPQDEIQPQNPPARGTALQRGLWNVAMERWAPKTQPARIVFEIGVLAIPLLILAILVKLGSS